MEQVKTDPSDTNPADALRSLVKKAVVDVTAIMGKSRLAGPSLSHPRDAFAARRQYVEMVDVKTRISRIQERVDSDGKKMLGVLDDFLTNPRITRSIEVSEAGIAGHAPDLVRVLRRKISDHVNSRALLGDLHVLDAHVNAEIMHSAIVVKALDDYCAQLPRLSDSFDDPGNSWFTNAMNARLLPKQAKAIMLNRVAGLQLGIELIVNDKRFHSRPDDPKLNVRWESTHKSTIEFLRTVSETLRESSVEATTIGPSGIKVTATALAEIGATTQRIKTQLHETAARYKAIVEVINAYNGYESDLQQSLDQVDAISAGIDQARGAWRTYLKSPEGAEFKTAVFSDGVPKDDVAFDAVIADAVTTNQVITRDALASLMF